MSDRSTSSNAIWGLIPCAGSGARAATRGPKQYEVLLGKPLVQHTLEAFAQVAEIRSTLVVLAPRDEQFGEMGLASMSRVIHAACGGETRAQSVYNGLQHLLRGPAQPNDWVLVHDAARCLVRAEQIRALIGACRDDPVGGLLAHPLPDTLKVAAKGTPARASATVARGDKWLAQTPQMFRLGTLAQALAQAGPEVTDESSAIEALGLAPLLVEGGAHNFKVTYPDDFALALAVLEHRARQAANNE